MIKHSACLALSCLFGSLPLALSAQANDNCTNATTITVGLPGSCPGASITGNNGAATDSNSPPSCDPSTNGYQDVWYTFNTGNNTEVSITVSPLGATDWNYVIYDACFGSELVCVTVPTGTQTYNVSPNSNFFLQVESNLDFGAGGTFQLCMEGNAGGGTIANDECSSATALTMGTSCLYSGSSTLNATVSSQPYSCPGILYEDVWFTFVATALEVNIEVEPAAAMDPALALYSGTCANPVLMECMDDLGGGSGEYLLSIPVVIGQTYRVRVHDANGGAFDVDFGICVWGIPPPPPAPANDDCDDAIVVPMLSSCTFVNGDTYGATYGGSGSSCTNGTLQQEVWYEFVATSGDVRITVDGGGSAQTGFDPAVRLLFSTDCSTFNEIACENSTGPGATEVLEFSGINPGSTYYVDVFHAGTGSPAITTFGICVQDISSGASVGGPDDLLDLTATYDRSEGCITTTLPMGGTAHWRILDMVGRPIEEGTYVARSREPQRLVLHGASSGAYVYTVTIGGRSGVKRLVLN